MGSVRDEYVWENIIINLGRHMRGTENIFKIAYKWMRSFLLFQANSMKTSGYMGRMRRINLQDKISLIKKSHTINGGIPQSFLTMTYLACLSFSAKNININCSSVQNVQHSNGFSETRNKKKTLIWDSLSFHRYPWMWYPFLLAVTRPIGTCCLKVLSLVFS